ncbi:MAG: DUF1570 domain-containing protein [Planctomycetaceae bacterium]|nr:DUF1570 domain-containing protein [Planctomycetaceae bacterium]
MTGVLRWWCSTGVLSTKPDVSPGSTPFSRELLMPVIRTTSPRAIAVSLLNPQFGEIPPRTASPRRVILLLAVLCCVLLGPGGEQQARAWQRQSSANSRNLSRRSGGQVQTRDLQRLARVREQHAALREKFSADLNELASWCDEHRFPEAAARIRRLARPVDPQMLLGSPLPAEVQPDLSPSLPAEERHWQAQLRFLQREFAADLYLLSRRVLNDGSPSYAYDLVREVARHDPDHRTARRLLGYVRLGEEWVTPYAARMQRSRNVWHERFGWLPKTHVERYEAGERFFRGRWMSARQEEEIRRDFSQAWEVHTEHFLVKTNHSLERGVEVATALEDFYGFFFQTFAAFFTDSEQMKKLFSGGSRSTTVPHPHEVHYYRTRDEYNAKLVSKIPQIAITNGLYYTNDRTSYFFHDPEQENDATLFHEATHQMLYESSSRDRAIAQNAHFWIIEGIACYMESFHREKETVSLGDPRYTRFVAARYRYMVDSYYVPLAEFDAMSMLEFQTSRDIARNYSQASGLSHFFMHYDGGRYRDALIEHLAQHYQVQPGGLRRIQSLDELTGVSMAELDRQYGEYTREVQAAIRAELEDQAREGAAPVQP